MELNNILKIVLVVAGISLVSGCVSQGTQTYSYSDGSNFTLHPDGTFYIHLVKNTVDYTGAYRLEDNGNILYLVFSPFGVTERLTKSGSDWVDSDGWVWEESK